MNFFEGELRQMFGNAENISDAKFVGRTMLGKLGDDLLVKAQFISTHISKHYDALQVSILNRTDGVVDKETMVFGDIIGPKMTRCSDKVNPYMWEENVGKAYWYTPLSISEKAQISDTVLDYVEMFQENNLAMQFKYTKLHKALKDGGYFVLTDYFSLTDEEEQMHRQNLIELKAEQGIADDEFYHYDTPLTVRHETEALLDAGFSSVEVLKNWGATFTIKAVK